MFYFAAFVANNMMAFVMVLVVSCVCICSAVTVTANNYTICNSKTTIVDPARPTHNIPMLLYFPCPMEPQQQFPYMVFGHAAESQDTWYDYIWKGMVPQGYIISLLGSYEYVSEQQNFARDQRYTNDWLRDTCNYDPKCPLYGMVAGKSIVSGIVQCVWCVCRHS